MEQIPTEWLGLDKLAYLQGEPTVRGMLKQQCSDFKVSEELGFEISGNGEHLFLHIKKQVSSLRFLFCRFFVLFEDKQLNNHFCN